MMFISVDGASTEAVPGPADFPQGSTWQVTCGKAEKDDGRRQQDHPLTQVCISCNLAVT